MSLFSRSAWVAAFGFYKRERETDSSVAHGFERDLSTLLLTYLVVIALDVITLPLAGF